MHRRDYTLIAKVLREAKKEIHMSIIIDMFCAALKAEASSFNETKFRDYIEKGG